MPLKQLVKKREELAAKQKVLRTILNEAKTDTGELDLTKITSITGTQEEILNEIRKKNEELDTLGKEVETLVKLDKFAESENEGDSEKSARSERFHEKSVEAKGFGDLFVRSATYKSRPANNICTGIIKGGRDLLLKATFETSAGWAPESIRIPRVIEEALRPIQVMDTIPSGRTTQAAIVYMEETTVTNAAAERNEGAAYAESALELTERTVTVRSIGTSLPVTDEQMADVAQVSSYINMRLPFLVKQRLDSQLLVGDGSAPNIRGINNTSGIQTQAKGTDPVPDAIYKGMDLIRVTGRSNPIIVYSHPNDWQGVRLLRTTDGVYIWGNPSEAGPTRIWGILVVPTDTQTENTMLVGDTMFSQLFTREDITVEIGYVNDDFKKGKKTFRAGIRVALVVYRPAAFCKITGV